MVVSIIDAHQNSPSKQSLQLGFTLIEVLVVISIMAILATLAVPSITNSLERQRNKEATELLIATLREARTESVLRRQDIFVQHSDQGIELTVRDVNNPTSSNRVTIKTVKYPNNTPVEANNASLVFRSNKSVAITTADPNGRAVYTTFCNKDKKPGRIVYVDNNGNVSSDSENSKC